MPAPGPRTSEAFYLAERSVGASARTVGPPARRRLDQPARLVMKYFQGSMFSESTTGEEGTVAYPDEDVTLWQWQAAR